MLVPPALTMVTWLSDVVESLAMAEAVTPAAWLAAAPVRVMSVSEAVRLPVWLLRPAAAPPTLSPVASILARRTVVVAPG